MDPEKFRVTPTKRDADSHVKKARKPQRCKWCDNGKTITRQSSTPTKMAMPVATKNSVDRSPGK